MAFSLPTTSVCHVMKRLKHLLATRGSWWSAVCHLPHRHSIKKWYENVVTLGTKIWSETEVHFPIRSTMRGNRASGSVWHLDNMMLLDSHHNTCRRFLITYPADDRSVTESCHSTALVPAIHKQNRHTVIKCWNHLSHDSFVSSFSLIL